MGIKYKKKIGPVTVAVVEVDVNPVLNFFLLGYPKRKAIAELEQGGFKKAKS